MMGTASQRLRTEEGMAQSTAEDAVSTEALAASPFALMLPEVARKIVERAAASKVPGRFCSPLSNPKLPGAAEDDDD
jgi:hypothetical protein